MTDEFEERRRFFRVNDSVNLAHKVVDDAILSASSHVSNDVLSNCSLSTALEILDQESQTLALRIERRDPELIAYLRIIEAKINLIGRAVMPDEALSQREKQDVSLSASGIGFSNDQTLPVGALLELRLLLSSMLAIIVVHARVVDSKKRLTDDDQPVYQISAEFVNLSDDDQELLIKHIVKRELHQLREKGKS